MDVQFSIKPRERWKCSLPIFGYVYRIKDTLNGKSYIGARYAKGIDIHNDLGFKYFGSSKLLNKARANSRNPNRRFVYEIRKIFVNNILLDKPNSDIISTGYSHTNVLKHSLLSYESSLLKKLKAGSNPKLYNLVYSYEHYMEK